MIRVHDSLRPLMSALANITPHYRNPVSYDIDGVNHLIDRVGVCWPIIASARTNEILFDGGMYEALMSRGERFGPVIYLDDANEEEALVILVAHYAFVQEAWLDPGLELPLIKDLMATEWGLVGTGYDDGIFDRRMTELEEAMENGFGEGPPTVTCPGCHRVFEIDRVR